MDAEWLVALGSIMLINLVLSGDNAIIIALASRSLPPAQQKKAIFWGSFGAVFFRIILTFIAVYLLQVPYLQLIGGLALLYIAVRVLAPKPHALEEDKQTDNLWEAIKIILIADVIMSLDNVLAVAGAASGDLVLLTLGLVLSIPIVIYGSKLLSTIMDKYPIIVYAGAGILGWTAAKMMVNDVSAGQFFAPFALPLEIVLTAGTLAVGHWLKKRQAKDLEKPGEVA